MAKDELACLDVALAAATRAMYARLLKDEDKSKIALIQAPDDLVTFLRHTEGWSDAAKEMPPSDLTAERFSLYMERQLYREYERLYRFAQASAKEFLAFVALHVKCHAVLSALSRLASPNSKPFENPLPPFFRSLPGYNIEAITKAATFQELVAAVGGDYGSALSAMERDPVTGLPHYAEAAITLEQHYYRLLNDFLCSRYEGPDREALMDNVGFRSDLLTVSYLMRLRRFNTPPEKAMDARIPIPGSLSMETERAILTAQDDGEAARLVSRALRHRQIGDIQRLDESALREAEAKYFRKIMHGPLTLSVTYAFLVLKEAECDMLKRAYVALQYEFDPEIYM